MDTDDDKPEPVAMPVPHCWLEDRCIRCGALKQQTGTTDTPYACVARKLSLGGW